MFDHLPLSQIILNNYFQGSSTTAHRKHTIIFNIQGPEPPLPLMSLLHFSSSLIFYLDESDPNSIGINEEHSLTSIIFELHLVSTTLA